MTDAMKPSALRRTMPISRRKFVGTLLAASALSGASAALGAGAAATRPNIITIILDDVGYSDIGCFGSEVRTPSMDRLAATGLRYNHFDTKAVCSSSRAAALTGRNSHTVNMPDVPDVAGVLSREEVAGKFRIPHNARNIAEVLKPHGYATWAVGKWHLIPNDELPVGASRESWPRQRGFDYFYGFARGWTDQYHPDLVENNDYIHPELPEGYHLSTDLVDKAIDLVEKRDRARPFYMNLAFGAGHVPIQVPREYSRKYDSVYSRGWDAIRSERYARMKKMGIIPEHTDLSPRSDDDRAWADLSDAEKTVFARYMAVYAGFIEHCDEQIGRLLDTLDAQGIADDTVIVLFSDNGAASEAGQKGDFDGLYRPNTLSIEEQLRRIDEIGTARTEAGYPRPWALAGDTPLRRYKLWPYSGGTRTPMIVRWHGEVPDPGAIRHQYVDVIDIAPTVLEAAGARFEAIIDGVHQIPVAGRSFAASIRDKAAPGRQVQYFLYRGNRAITSGDWRAVAMHDCDTTYEQDHWQLFNLAQDFSETHDLAQSNPKKLQALQALWQSEWARYGTGPLQALPEGMCRMAKFYNS
jgi:arylsulfatase